MQYLNLLVSNRILPFLGLIGLSAAGFTIPVKAQIVPDTTLGPESSGVDVGIINGQTVDLINGGAIRGTNLFHSFEQFNINELQQVYFNDPIGIETILSRVTGPDTSEIMGTLGVNGTADLFLLNPNGILFGENARLDVDGSFIATTADALQFDSLGTFGGRNPETPSPLLTIAPSAFLFSSAAAGTITNQSVFTEPSDSDFPDLSVGLRVPNGEDLLLLGGDVVVDGGNLSAFGGRIGIGSVAGEGIVSLGDDGRFTIPDEAMRGSIRFENEAVIDAALDGGGDIQVIGRTIDSVSSIVQTGIQAEFGTVDSQAGDVVLDATERITIDGFFESDSDLIAGVFSIVADSGLGNAGNVTITTPVLNVLNGSQIGSDIRGTGAGTGGGVTITATERITLDSIADNEFEDSSGVFSDVLGDAVGNAGSITITTPILNILNGAQISANALGRGAAGNITITASERITVDGFSASEDVASLITSDAGNNGKAGSIIITTPILNVLNGSEIGSGVFGNGDGGSVTIFATQSVTVDGADDRFSGIFSEVYADAVGDGGSVTIITPVLNVLNGGQIGSDVLGRGNGGRVTITASERITLDGSLATETFPSGIFSDVKPEARGNGGEITIATPILQVLNRALINSENQGEGNAGKINIIGDVLVLENEAEILTATRSGDGGNISLALQAVLQLRQGSRISSSAGTIGAGGNGGNITINVENGYLLAEAPRENNDITANAFDGNGGQITIATPGLFQLLRTRPETTEQLLKDHSADTEPATLLRGIFGLTVLGRADLETLLETTDPNELDPVNLPSNDITAISQNNPTLSGGVVFQTPEIDPSQGTLDLPTNLVESVPINAACNAVAQGGSAFILSGRGGLPPDPTDSLSTSSPWEDWYISHPQLSQPSLPPTIHSDNQNNDNQNNDVVAFSSPIIEAQGWVQSDDGQVSLITNSMTTTPANDLFMANCQQNHISKTG